MIHYKRAVWRPIFRFVGNLFPLDYASFASLVIRIYLPFGLWSLHAAAVGSIKLFLCCTLVPGAASMLLKMTTASSVFNVADGHTGKEDI